MKIEDILEPDVADIPLLQGFPPSPEGLLAKAQMACLMSGTLSTKRLADAMERIAAALEGPKQ